MNFLSPIKKFLLDLLFPIFCLGCKKEGTWLCKDCLAKIKLNKEQACPMCGRKTQGEFCSVCQIAFSLKGIIVASSYKNKLLQNTIKTYKYRFAEELNLPLSEILISAILKSSFFLPFEEMKSPTLPLLQRGIKGDFLENTVLIPVPLHKKRLLWRGFNQAELLTHEIGKKFNLPVLTNVLTRTKNTAPQTQLKFLERHENIKNGFSCLQPDLISGKNIILIDDVATTCATLEECAKTLISAGKPLEIWGLVLAKG